MIILILWLTREEESDLELLQLRYFEEVARTQHVTNSAKRLNVAQPALTQSIKRLERELGVELLERVGRNVRLTPCGEVLHERVEPMLAALDALPAELADAAGRERSTVRLAIESASALAVEAVAAYRARRPNARFVVMQDAAQRWDVRLRTVRHAVDDRDAMRRGAERDDEPPARVRFTERIGAAVPAERDARGPLSLDELASEPFICLAGSRMFRAVCNDLCANAGFEPRVAFESDSPAVVKRMIGLGLGVGFWPERSWGDLADGNARLEPLADARFARTLEITRRDGRATDEAAAFFDFLVAFFESRWSEPSPFDARGRGRTGAAVVEAAAMRRTAAEEAPGNDLRP